MQIQWQQQVILWLKKRKHKLKAANEMKGQHKTGLSHGQGGNTYFHFSIVN